MTKRKTKRKTNRKIAKTKQKTIRTTNLKPSYADWYPLPTAGKTFTFDGMVYTVITCEQITEYKSGTHQPIFRQVFLKGIRKIDAKETI